MSVISRIESIQNELSASEKKLFHYIKQNPEKVPAMTAEQLAVATKISAPTVVRFAKKIGYQSLTDFKIQLSTEIHQPINSTGYSDVDPSESIEILKTKMSHNAQITIQETSDILSEEILLAALTLLEAKEKIFLAGVGASELVAEDILQKWGRIGKSIRIENNYNNLLPQLVNNQETSVLWLISNSGQTPEIISYAEYAKKLKIPVISLTRFGNNPLSKLADVAIQVSRPKESDRRSAATNSIIAHFLAVDILFYLFISRNNENAEKINRSREIIDVFREKFL
ncbi:MurR/RpiR family transcriptional regulator [Enterococcus songbeiensis]|uniref:MurR/RpiR family transcriptional regulator n=1 Tax=Enterococcus songbeiensis TaxID=2559927 RepID=UPI0010F8651B|nr:MurR/RpiR family transcriptional regulator [Enterococcus songbeiensis]